ncbi:sodium-coupled monocarboxylate transporter 1-like [Portunus trituberculatus]|uniref:sodium-coupled monocarboxylate transporter 1-like n=1 Tax=Portunus trituberculatus TaxID=210409 RepID=UPI001E1CFF68|nr:sodium-coupled monocarboxylate transporter 1-like [Portunus trituberculatus]
MGDGGEEELHGKAGFPQPGFPGTLRFRKNNHGYRHTSHSGAPVFNMASEILEVERPLPITTKLNRIARVHGQELARGSALLPSLLLKPLAYCINLVHSMLFSTLRGEGAALQIEFLALPTAQRKGIIINTVNICHSSTDHKDHEFYRAPETGVDTTCDKMRMISPRRSMSGSGCTVTANSHSHFSSKSHARYTMEATEAASAINTIEFHFGVADWTIFVLLLVVSVLIGVGVAVRDRGHASPLQFLLGGKNMPPIAVALSLLGGWVSAISILGNSTEVYFHGTQITTTLLGVIPATIIMHQITTPILYNLKLYSINEYLQLRYQSAALRKVGTSVVLLNTSFHIGMSVYAPSLALATVTSISPINSVLIAGAIVTFYITVGGVKAVVYTDVLQTLLMLAGVLAVVVICCMKVGGVEEVWATAGQGGRLEFFNLDTSLNVRHTFWSTVCLGFAMTINIIALDQPIYQRLASVRSLRISKRLVWFFLVGLWCLWSLFFFSGLVAYATYNTCDPLTSGKINKPDQIIPFLITDKLGYIPGLSGVFVAAVYGGVLSTVSSAANSMACLVWQDFLKPVPYFAELKEFSVIRIIKTLSFLAGLVGTVFGITMGSLGNIFQVIYSLNGAIAGPLKGLFLAGMVMPWVNAKGAFVGFLVSFCFSVWLMIGQLLNGDGTPPPLPLSVEACPLSSNFTLDAFTALTNMSHSYANITVEHYQTTKEILFILLQKNQHLPRQVTPCLPLERSHCEPQSSPSCSTEEEKGISNISYCYNGMIALLISMVVSGVVSLLIKPTPPEDLTEGVVNPTCERLYRKWYYARRRTTGNLEPVNGSQEVVTMLPVSDTNLHSPQ